MENIPKNLKYSQVPREEFLALNMKDLKQSSPSSLQTKIVLSKGPNNTLPMAQRVVKPCISSLSDQIFVSRNKLSRGLLHSCRHGFQLDDPHIRKTRFFVDYHRLHDPALKRYYKSIPVRNRLKKINAINGENDAGCTRKEFVEYLNYLDRNLSMLKAHSNEMENQRRLSDHQQSLTQFKEKESQFTGIFRRKRVRRESRLDTSLFIEKAKKHKGKIEKENQVVERALVIKKAKENQFKWGNSATNDKIKLVKRKVFLDDIKKRSEMKLALDKKLESAQKRKESMEIERKKKKLESEIDNFVKHSIFREKKLAKNNRLLEIYEEEQHKRLEVRRKRMQKIHELHESKLIQNRRQMTLRHLQAAKSTKGHSIVDKIIKHLPKMKRKYMPIAKLNEETMRRFSVLKRPFVENYVERAYKLYKAMKLPIKEDNIVEQAMFEMTKHVVIVPGFCDLICTYSQKRMAETITRAVNSLKVERARGRKSEFARKQRDKTVILSTEEAKNTEIKTEVNGKTVNFDTEEPQIETEDKNSTYKTHGRDKMYNIDDVIATELNNLFEIITKSDFVLPEEFKDRSYMHLYDFQKIFIYKSTEQFIELVTKRIDHDKAYNDSSIVDDLIGIEEPLNYLVQEAASMLMHYDSSPEEIGKFVLKIGSLIRNSIDVELNMNFLSQQQNSDF